MTKFIHLFSTALLHSCIFFGLVWTPFGETMRSDTKLGLEKNTSLASSTFRHPRFIPIICSNCSIFLKPQKKPGSGLGGVNEDEEDCERRYGCSEDGRPCCSGLWCSDGDCMHCGFGNKPCQTDSDCEQCPGTTCRNGYCKRPEATCLGKGSTCPQNLPCCQDQGLTCVDGECAANCRDFGKSCSANKPCCENLRCYVTSGDSGRCATIPKGCSKNGDSCRSECDCCNTFATCDRYSGNCRWSAVAHPNCRFRRGDGPVYPIPLVG